MLHEQKQEIEDKYAVVLRRHQERMGLKAEFIGDEAQVQKLEETAVKLMEMLHIKTMASVAVNACAKKVWNHANARRRRKVQADHTSPLLCCRSVKTIHKMNTSASQSNNNKENRVDPKLEETRVNVEKEVFKMKAQMETQQKNIQLMLDNLSVMAAGKN